MNFGVEMVARIIGFVLDKINENKAYREVVINLGAELRELIPGDDIEPELGETIDLFKMGLIKGKAGLKNDDVEVKKAINKTKTKKKSK